MKDKLKLKVVFGFLIATLAVVFASYLTIKNFNQLNKSLESLSHPDQKVQKLNKILEDITETERIVRSYTLSNDKQYLDDFYNYSRIIEKELDSMKQNSKSDPVQYKKIDSIDVLWSARLNIFDEFIDLKNQERLIDKTSEAINRISTEVIDTVKIKTTTTTKKTEVSQKEVAPVRTDAEGVNSEKGWVTAFFDKLFGKSKPGGEIEEQPFPEDSLTTLTETQVTYDTVITEADAREIIESIVQILSEYEQKELYLQRISSDAEFRLLKKDAQIMEQIRGMVKDLHAAELQRTQLQSSASREIAQKSIFTILAVGLSGLIISIIFISVILKDITKSNFYKNRLIAAKKRAEKLAKAKEEFLANMSHEIRTPLSAILGFTEQLMKLDIKEKQRFYLEAVKNSSEHLLATVNDILDFSKIESGQLTLDNSPFRIQDQIKEVTETLRLKAEEKGIGLKYAVDEEFKKVVNGDPFRLKQILINLVGNAVKFTEKGQVKIIGRRLSMNDKYIHVKISVRDSGIGIPREKLNSIFHDFSQADTTITRKYGGTGLGLAITKKLVLLHKGKIYVDSEPGKGSVFTVEMRYPLGNEADLLKTELSEDLVVNLSDKRVLVVDDDEYNLLLFHTILRKWDMKIDMASNGRDGLEAVKKNKYDLVLSDIHMPEMSGIELVDNMRKDSQNKQTPIFAITANVMQKDIDSFLKAGFDGCVTKPFKEKDLYTKIASLWNLDPKKYSPEPEETDPQPVGEARFSLKDIERFADGDEKSLVAMMQGLIDNNRLNIYHLHQYCNNKRWAEVARVSHKMLPSFNHLKASEVVKDLREIEQFALQKKGYKEISERVEKVKNQTSVIFKALEERIKLLKDKRKTVAEK